MSELVEMSYPQALRTLAMLMGRDRDRTMVRESADHIEAIEIENRDLRQHMMVNMTACIEALRVENERLRKALERISADRVVPIGPDTDEYIADLCDYRKRVALAALGGEHE